MRPTEAEDWRAILVHSRDLVTAGEREDFYREVRRGEFVAIFRGVHARAEVWATLDEDCRYRVRVHAVARMLEPTPAVFSHHSAAALWRLPFVGRWPDRAHVLAPVAKGGRSSASVVRHTVDYLDEPHLIDGLLVVSPARVVVDLAASESLGAAVAVADAALRRQLHPEAHLPAFALTQEDLLRELRRIPVRHGSAKVRRVLELADGRADRPGESLSRVNMILAHIETPQLQAVLRGASGQSWTVDFWWPDFGVIGEFDGRFKYSDARFLRGRTPHQVLLDEKDREDDLRAAGYRVSRWQWETAMSPTLLGAHLRRAGVR